MGGFKTQVGLYNWNIVVICCVKHQTSNQSYLKIWFTAMGWGCLTSPHVDLMPNLRRERSLLQIWCVAMVWGCLIFLMLIICLTWDEKVVCCGFYVLPCFEVVWPSSCWSYAYVVETRKLWPSRHISFPWVTKLMFTRTLVDITFITL